MFPSGLFVGVDQVQTLHNSSTQVPCENAGFPIPQKLTYLTLVHVEDIITALASALVPILGPIGILRYPTKPRSVAVQVPIVSICAYLQGILPMSYERAGRDILSSEVSKTYTTIKTKLQLEQNVIPPELEHGKPVTCPGSTVL